MCSASPAGYGRGVRLPWAGLPAQVQDRVGAQLGGRVTEVEDRLGGFSPGCAAVVATSSRRGFVKAVSDRPHATSLELYRQERDRFAALPDHPALPKPLARTDLTVDGVPWSVSLLPALPGPPPAHPWTEPQARLVFDRWADLSRMLVAHPGTGLPDPSGLVGFFDRWPELLDDADDRGRRGRGYATGPRGSSPVPTGAARGRGHPARPHRPAGRQRAGGRRSRRGPNRRSGSWTGRRPGRPPPGSTRRCWPPISSSPAPTAARGTDRRATVSGRAPDDVRYRPGAALAPARGAGGDAAPTLPLPAPAGLPTIRGWEAGCAERMLTFVSSDLGPPDRVW